MLASVCKNNARRRMGPPKKIMQACPLAHGMVDLVMNYPPGPEIKKGLSLLEMIILYKTLKSSTRVLSAQEIC